MSAKNAPPENPLAFHIKWYKSLGALAVLSIGLFALWLLAGIIFIMNTTGSDLVLNESSRLIEQTGNNVISNLEERSRQVEALCRSTGNAAERLPKQESLFKQVIPHIIDFQGDNTIAGGGVWPEPYAFQKQKKLRSFFWGRNDQGILKYYDDYNSGRGYHNDEWYPVVKYSRPGKCFWSKSYVDPYSLEPMITCSYALKEEENFWGVSTIDLKLEGLQAFTERWAKQTGGYIFILDRTNKFLAFPKPEMMRRKTSSNGIDSVEFLSATDLAKKEPLFLPMLGAVQQMDRDILRMARESPSYDARLIQKIDDESDQIDHAEAEFITAIIADPLAEQTISTKLYYERRIDNDFLLGDESLLYVFHVPSTYWKLVIVKPLSEAQAVASKISNVLIALVVTTVFLGVVPVGLLSHRLLTRPLRNTAKSVQEIGFLVSEQRIEELENKKIHNERRDELGLLSTVINTMSFELRKTYASLKELNENLERKVDERTEESERLRGEMEKQWQRAEKALGIINAEIAHARVIQQHLLPKTLPNLQGIDFAAIYEPMDKVGGDLYDFVEMADGRVGIFIADVSGHGIPAAMIAMIAKVILSVAGTEIDSPGELLKDLNDQLFGRTADNFLTSFMGIISKDRKTLTYATAGHPPFILVRNSVATFHAGKGPAIAFSPGVTYKNFEIPLEAHDRIYFYTDGIAEPMKPNGEMFGEDQVAEFLASPATQNSPIGLALHMLVLAAREFQGGGPFEDDITLVAVEISEQTNIDQSQL